MKTLAVILNHNMPDITDNLYNCLKPYEKQDYDLYVVDNGSQKEKISKFTTHSSDTNVYYGGGINLCFSLFHEMRDKYDSIMVFNNDIILHGYNFIKTLREEMFQKDYGILSPCVLQPESGQCYHRSMHCWNSKEIRDVKWVDFQCPLIHGKVVDKIQQYPMELIYGWGQDLYSGMMCEDNKWKVGVVDWTPVIHMSSFTYKTSNSNISLSEYSKRAETKMVEYFTGIGEGERMWKYRNLYGENTKTYFYP